jgi:chloramphenicol 3-O phosphotransferase
MAVIVILNGNSSAGKSSIAKALQQVTAESFLHVPMDAFTDMMPASMLEGPDRMVFRSLEEGGRRICEITIGPAAQRTVLGMRHAMAALACHGSNLIVDDVMLDGDAAEYAEAFAGHTVHWVGVFAPLEVLEMRERQRGDRDIGLSRRRRALHRGISQHPARQLNRDPEPVMRPMPTARIGLKKGDLVLLPSARLVDDFIRAIPKGKSVSLLEMRNKLARRHKADGTCPVYLGYRLRTVAEAAFKALDRGAALKDITPIWRVLDEKALTLKKLSADRVALLLAQRRKEKL